MENYKNSKILQFGKIQKFYNFQKLKKLPKIPSVSNLESYGIFKNIQLGKFVKLFDQGRQQIFFNSENQKNS